MEDTPAHTPTLLSWSTRHTHPHPHPPLTVYKTRPLHPPLTVYKTRPPSPSSQSTRHAHHTLTLLTVYKTRLPSPSSHSLEDTPTLTLTLLSQSTRHTHPHPPLTVYNNIVATGNTDHQEQQPSAFWKEWGWCRECAPLL